jgi:hypothetical protein
MKIGGWNRLLIVLSVVWILWSSLDILIHYPSITPQLASSLTPNSFFSIVTTGNSGDPFHVVTHYLAIASYVILPLAFLWIFAAVVRWIKRGFQQDVA